jgi:hypothetical protein
MNTKPPECWANDPQARAVRIELSPDRSLLLPHDEFAFSELKREGKEQTLRLVFTVHEVLIRGHSLRRIETAMQRMELSALNTLPANQRSLVADGQPVVLEIKVTEAKEED